MFRNDLDVSDRVKTTDPSDVNKEIDRIFLDLYPEATTKALDIAFGDADRIYRGEMPGFHACDTAYHDIQHVLDVTLAMARLIDGYERSRVGTDPMGKDLFQLGVITALFHDVGYIRRESEKQAQNGAEFTMVHVSRGAQFLKEYLPRVGMPEMADIAADLVHFTGYERPVKTIQVPSLTYRLLGNLLGSADIIAQMADRCYLEKCRDRLYPEFVTGGIATKKTTEGKIEVIFSSAEDLLKKTPGFYAGASRRLQEDLGNGLKYAENYFGGQNLYVEGAEKNMRFAEHVRDQEDFSLLKRAPPDTLPPEAVEAK
ncbi:MAG: HD domain-containing protein [Burkholderiales bacterium]